MPYLFPFPNGTISQGIKAQNDELNNNFIIAGGGANGGSFDNGARAAYAPQPARLPTPRSLTPPPRCSPCPPPRARADDGSSFYHMHHNVEVYGGACCGGAVPPLAVPLASSHPYA